MADHHGVGQGVSLSLLPTYMKGPKREEFLDAWVEKDLYNLYNQEDLYNE